jgi:hypothetical protein
MSDLDLGQLSPDSNRGWPTSHSRMHTHTHTHTHTPAWMHVQCPTRQGFPRTVTPAPKRNILCTVTAKTSHGPYVLTSLCNTRIHTHNIRSNSTLSHTQDSRPDPGWLWNYNPAPEALTFSLSVVDGMSTVSPASLPRQRAGNGGIHPSPCGPEPLPPACRGSLAARPVACTVTAARTRAHPARTKLHPPPARPQPLAHLAGAPPISGAAHPRPQPASGGSQGSSRGRLPGAPAPRHSHPAVPSLVLAVLTAQLPERGGRRAPGATRAPEWVVQRVLSAALVVGTLASPPPEDSPRRLLRNKGAGRGRRVQGTRREQEEEAHLPTEVPGGWGPAAVGHGSTERSMRSLWVNAILWTLVSEVPSRTGRTPETALPTHTHPALDLAAQAPSFCQTKDAPELEGVEGTKYPLPNLWSTLRLFLGNPQGGEPLIMACTPLVMGSSLPQGTARDVLRQL